MTVVVGTAGHIDHGKTTLLRALTGIDADRLPEERRRGMTIDVGYAHLTSTTGPSIDFVDVPGHDRLVGNMLVGAGEIDAALLVVAADDGPRAQTLEHLALLDALGVVRGLAVVTKIDAVEPERVAVVAAAVHDLLAPTSLAGSPILAASGATGEGLGASVPRSTTCARPHRPHRRVHRRSRSTGSSRSRVVAPSSPGRCAAGRSRRAPPCASSPASGRSGSARSRSTGQPSSACRRWTHRAQPRRDRASTISIAAWC